MTKWCRADNEAHVEHSEHVDAGEILCFGEKLLIELEFGGMITADRFDTKQGKLVLCKERSGGVDSEGPFLCGKVAGNAVGLECGLYNAAVSKLPLYSSELQLTAQDADKVTDWELPSWFYPGESRKPLTFHPNLQRSWSLHGNRTKASMISKKWWSEMSGYYELHISDAVLQELNNGNYPRKDEIIRLVSAIPLLPLAPDLEQVVEFYISNYVMPRSLVGDALHLAYASYFDIQYLLTWNCNHLANANERKHIRVVNARLGLSTPEIVTPLELFKEENNL